ncbi:MAG: hypothetical protein H0V72_17455 [Bradyrhizobium sp.]|nr:hypothetical protein [Bradyrhizobium sp.]
MAPSHPRPRGRDRAGALAVAEANLRSARAFFYEAVDEAWQLARQSGAIEMRHRASLRLAAIHATSTASDVTRSMYDLGGGSSVLLSSPLQRRFRDAHVTTEHIMVAPPTYELSGRVFMGLPVDKSASLGAPVSPRTPAPASASARHARSASPAGCRGRG